ncbi:RdRP-domain-containing protein [Meira miltonrushii]|uniref:RNA-dependent RNA polymerase n=1 Tax=Meira miltonrushii TaxID=1280837 RepID=A0A316V8D3_9BASI|nr:RdRP-domain-containing protein [Meira miltonrushii]PWN33849.1 RdRP-domain-containing protein [Meira miltonrushii]
MTEYRRQETAHRWENGSRFAQRSDFWKEGLSISTLLDITSVECGGFDDQDRFCQGWKKDAKTPASVVSFDLNDLMLYIRIDHDVIQADIVQIANIFSNYDKTRLYITFKYSPVFLRDAIPEDFSKPNDWLEGESFDLSHSYGRYLRVGAFDDVHKQCAQYGTVYRLCISDPPQMDAFFRGTCDRLELSCSLKEKEDGPLDAFNMDEFMWTLSQMSIEVGFQAQALVVPNGLLPKDIIELSQEIQNIESRLGVGTGSQAIRHLRNCEINRGPFSRFQGLKTVSLFEMKSCLQGYTGEETEMIMFKKQGQPPIHSAFLTPSYGIRLEGPNHDQGNRILRQYPGYEKHFLRIRFIEEDGADLSIRREYGVDSQLMLKERYGNALKREGILVAGRRFHFLAYSNSGLRELTSWFVCNFTNQSGEVMTAEKIRESIGDLSGISNPARFAARMGQAFTTSMISVELKRSWIRVEPDLATQDGKYEFSDGIGMISPAVGQLVLEAIEQFKGPIRPIQAFQIRLAGAKGMVVVNPTLDGHAVILRKSMVKFPLPDVEVVMMEVPNYYSIPFTMYLNRQFINLLATLGVPAETFLEFQNDAIDALQKASLDPIEASALHKSSSLGRAANFKPLITMLNDCGINAVRQVDFLRDVNNSFIDYALRKIKYHARIPVPLCHTLVGGLDEFGVLLPNQIIACIFEQEAEEPRYLEGPCLVGRNPMLAPGDVQSAFAVRPPKDHPLSTIHNVVLFSQKGKRPLVSMLAGGDLDGDIYFIVQHPKLLKIKIQCEPADYQKSELLQFQNKCTIDDVADFFLDYIRLHSVGPTATRHLQLSDQRVHGALDADCIRLAQMHSIAVDFCKTGVTNQFGEMPVCSRQRPDFMQRESDIESIRANSRIKTSQPSRSKPQFEYYQSNKALGLLFRAIDVYTHTKRFAEEADLIIKDEEKKLGDKNASWTEKLWDHLSRQERAHGWVNFIDQMKPKASRYYHLLTAIAKDHCVGEKMDELSEEEVFMGHIFARPSSGARLKPYDASTALQDDFENLCKQMRLDILIKKEVRKHDQELFRAIWRWINNELEIKASTKDVEAQLDKALGEKAKDVQKRNQLLNNWSQELHYAIQQGCAFIDVTLAKPEYGRSAPWIIVPAVLKAHQCIDCIENVWLYKSQYPSNK